ncbi:MAG: alpha/beta hydrolase family protein [Candidatus Gracilibacteria bacterium]
MQQLHSFLAADGLELHGLLHTSGSKSCVIHIHGLGGNFYKDWYTPAMVSLYKEKGYDYFTFNNRGADFVKRMKYPKEDRQRWLGYSYEIFEESVYDIEGVIEYLKSLGYTSFILQGHSSGCQKALFAITQKEFKEVQKLILLSPCDDRGLYLRDWSEEGLEKRLELASKHLDTLITDPDFFMGMPISGNTFLSHFAKGSAFDCFHYYDEDRTFAELEKNPLPTLVLFGSDDYVIDFKNIERVFAEHNNYDLHIIEGAGHKYDGFENELKTVISSFL